MAFVSQHQHLIWNKLYTVLIPDQYTLDKAYLSKFGTYSSGNKQIDEMMSNNFTTVMIPISKILEYFIDGIPIQIPSRDDMIQMHKDIELYLLEWKDYIKYNVNHNLHSYQQLILSLEKLSKYIYSKTKPNEVIDTLFMHKTVGGLVSPLQRIQEQKKELNKPDYEGISSLVRSKVRTKTRYE